MRKQQQTRIFNFSKIKLILPETNLVNRAFMKLLNSRIFEITLSQSFHFRSCVHIRVHLHSVKFNSRNNEISQASDNPTFSYIIILFY